MARKQSFLIFCYLFFSLFSFAQKNKIPVLDSLVQQLIVIHKSEPRKAIKIGKTILENPISDEQKSRVLGFMAVSYFLENEIDISTELLFEAKSFAEKTGDHELIAKMYGSIAHQYVQLNLNEKAKLYLDKAISEINLMEEGNAKFLLKGLSLLEMGNIMFDEKKYQIANENYKKSLKQFEVMIEPGRQVNYHYRRSLYNVGNSYFSIGKIDSAEFFLNKAYTLKNKTDPELDLFITATLSQIYAEKQMFQRAIDTLHVILENPNFNNFELRTEIYRKLSKNYKSLGDNENFAFYNEKYLTLNDSLKLTNIKALNTAFDQEKKEISSTLSKSQKRNQIVIMGGIILFIGFSILFILLNQKRKKEKALFQKIISNLKHEQSLEAENLTETPKLKFEGNTSTPNPIEVELLQKLTKFENSTKFTNPNLTLSTLAVQLKTNTTYLSEVINKYKEQNFNSYINKLRIEYICDKIYKNPEYLNYKISYLATESGFSSHSAFATVFKSITGISPSVFLREVAKYESYKPKATK